MRKIRTSENRGKLFSSKIVHEWNGHLEIFSLPQAIEISRKSLLLLTDILQKTVVGCPCLRSFCRVSWEMHWCSCA